MKIQIGPIHKSQIAHIARILQANDLPVDDINNPQIELFAADLDEKIIGVVGVEKYGEIGLLRSLAVAHDFKEKGIGKKLVNYFMDWCSQNGIQQVYLLTTTASKYFSKFGFNTIERNEVPEAIKSTDQFKDICPATAMVMKKIIL